MSADGRRLGRARPRALPAARDADRDRSTSPTPTRARSRPRAGSCRATTPRPSTTARPDRDRRRRQRRLVRLRPPRADDHRRLRRVTSGRRHRATRRCRSPTPAIGKRRTSSTSSTKASRRWSRPEALKRSTPRPGRDGGLYAFMRRVLESDAGARALPTTPSDDRTGLRAHQAQPTRRPLPTPRQIRLPLRMAAHHRHPQPPQALAPPDHDRRLTVHNAATSR